MIKHYKEKAVFLFLVMFALLAVNLSVAPPAAAQVVPDDLCLKVIITESEDGPLPAPVKFNMIVHLFTINAQHFTIWGKVSVPKDGASYVGGTGILEGNVLTMNLTTSQKHVSAWRDTGVMQVKFNISTMRGNWYEVGHDFDTANRVFDERYSAGIVVKCP
ncbi:MAG: hypothetical protein C4567_17675 [Deltaproteobacteria bacterium]|nr:MAG: hypothetical protein C4567_17675 [Deltaproteobacteria bacterium]